MLWDVTDLADAIGMSRQYVRNDIQAGRLEGHRNGRSKFVIEHQEADRYVAWIAAGRP